MKPNFSKFTAVLLVLFCFFVFFRCTQEKKSEGHNPVPKAKISYRQIKSAIEQHRLRFYRKYLQSQSELEKSKILEQSAIYLVNTFTNDVLPAWYGTPWDFNGVSREPGKGAIACGSFVVFTLQDAGFKIPTEMYKLPAEKIIKNLCAPTDIKRFSNAPMEQVQKWLVRKGEGVYIVGLDYHVGFIINKRNRITFCHANYFDPPKCVVNQPLLSYSPLTISHYRVIGKIFTAEMMRKWLCGERFGIEI